MESFIRRLKYYGIGFGIGLIAVFLIFGNRACNWGPKQRIKTSILERVVVINEINDSIKNALNITDDDLLELIESSDIDFGESKKENPLKVYKFTGEDYDFNITIPENSYISEVFFTPKEAKSILTTTSGFGRIVHFPKETDLLYIPEDSKSFKEMNQLNCKEANDLFELIKKSARIDFGRSKILDPWNLNHVLFCEKVNNKKVFISSYWYKEKIEISDIQIIDYEETAQ